MDGSFFTPDDSMRIRTVKPELFMHELLYDTELTTKLPIRLSYIGLFCACDREGRFKWEPRRLKALILPYDNTDFSRVLDALMTRGFISKYRVGDTWYGCIPSWKKHQVINNRERDSEYPELSKAEQVEDISTREPRETHACSKEGKGREGNMEQGKEQVTGIFDSMRVAISSKEKGTFEEVLAFCKEIELKDIDAEYCFNNWEGNGWTRAGKKIKDWKAVIRTWKSQSFFPSQKLHNASNGNSAVSTPPRGQIPVWKQIQTIEEQLETHKANPSFRGYRADQVTPEQKEHYENQKANLLRLKGLLV